MATHKKRTGKRERRNTPKSTVDAPRVIYIHGVGDKPDPKSLKREWDLALFGREMGSRTVMAYWADILHPTSSRASSKRARGERALGAKSLEVDELLRGAGVSPESEDAQYLVRSLLRKAGVEPVVDKAVRALPLPAFLRKPVARRFLESFIKDTAAYFFGDGMRERMQRRLRDVLPVSGEMITLVAHSQGSVIALEVLAEDALKNPHNIVNFVTIGSPLGIREVQDFLNEKLPDSRKLTVPQGIDAWNNFADPLDPVALDKGIRNDFDPPNFISDDLVINRRTPTLQGFNPHSAVGYLAHPKVRNSVCQSSRIDKHARFLVARDVAADFAIEARHPVLIEILEPGYQAVGESLVEMQRHESEVEKGQITIAQRIDRAAIRIEKIVGPTAVKDASIDKLRRFVAAHLTPNELNLVAEHHRDLRIYAMWKSSAKRKLISRSGRVVKADAARASFRAVGDGIRWAVLDTGARTDHPHFKKHQTIEAVWDCTKPGRPKLLESDRDRDGHGTHVSGIIAGSSEDTKYMGIAPMVKLIVYKVLDDSGSGEDAWIIKALDHIAEQNENNAEIMIHGLNLSLGGPYDATVYGCGFTPICVELRRQWRAGVIVVVASGNEGQVEVTTPDGALDLNSPMSIGDPANLEDCIAVGSVNADRPQLYGISAFSSRGPTSDGRLKPDVVAPGERILSCNSRFGASTESLYRSDSGTSMAAPHVSGLLAAFLSVRREYRGRPDEVKEILLRTATNLGRDRYHQGHGIPNLMKMLLEA
jgi:hypothetical protein